MHIAIDARSIFTGGGGDRTYFRELIQTMARLSPDDRWTLYAEKHDTDRDSLRAPNIVIALPLSAPISGLWNVTSLAPRLRRDRADLLHSQYTLPPVGPVSCPMIVTIHDATFRLFPQWFPRRANRVQNLLIPQSARRAARILTGSRSAAEDIHATMNVLRAKITVTPYGLDERFYQAAVSDQEEVRDRYGLPNNYVLGVGLLRTRKNVRVILEAMTLLLEQNQWPTGAVLALTGYWNGAPADAARRAQESHLAPHLRALGFVPDADLPALYAGAVVSVYPSLYEGFGFPVLEAMAAGSPVVSSDTSSLPEVVGDAGLLLPPDDSTAWADALRTLLEDTDARQDLVRRGQEQAARFTWERTARETLAVYREVVQQRL
ncbi:MAG: glycosyltransferase family 4 protein [Armatimonadota bacterium]|nr:glycosyltransferase family 4 protein [Armatimonadota bacterium]